MTLVHNNSMDSVPLIHPHKLAKDLHSRQEYVLLDCRPVLAYNSCHISGAVNVNFTGNDTAYRNIIYYALLELMTYLRGIR